MKPIFRLAALPLVALICSTVTATAAELDTELQKYSYALGNQMAQGLLRAGVEVDAKAFAAAVEDVLSGATPQLSSEEMTAVKQARARQAEQARNEQAEQASKDGEAFLAANRDQPGVTVLPSGLQYRVEKEGDGPIPGETDTVVVNYRGTLPDGTEFDSSYKRGEPATFALNRVIKGFQEALTKMKQGSKWTIFVPSELGYGPRGAGKSIGPNQTLVFEIELVEIRK